MTTTEPPRRGRGTAIGEGITWVARWSLRLTLVALGAIADRLADHAAVVDRPPGPAGGDPRDGALAADRLAAPAPLPARARGGHGAARRDDRAGRADHADHHVGVRQHPRDRGERVERHPVDPAVALRPSAEPGAGPARRRTADRDHGAAAERLDDHDGRAHRHRQRGVGGGHSAADARARLPVREGRAAVPAMAAQRGRGRRRRARRGGLAAGSGRRSATSSACRPSWQWSTAS